jgi:hypothetical protein
MGKVNQINRLVRFAEIKRIQNEGNIADYEQIEVSAGDIGAKADNAKRLREELKQLLPDIATKYYALSCDKEEDVKKKVDLLVDIEEIVKTSAKLMNKDWSLVYDKAKMGSMQVFARYARVGEPNLKGCITEYVTYGNYDDLCYIETALFEELKQLNVAYIKFQDKRKNKAKNHGSLREGYYLKSIEYVDIQQQTK